MTEVKLHIYDVTNSDSDKTNNTIVQINKIFKDRIGLGGIFHSAIQVYVCVLFWFLYLPASQLFNWFTVMINWLHWLARLINLTEFMF